MVQESPRNGVNRRSFLKGAALTGLGSVISGEAHATENEKILHVWSCGGLAEAMHPAHLSYEAAHGIHIAYTGAFAGALGKPLLAGTSETDVFCGRVLMLAKNLRKAGRMVSFRPLCFTSYVIAVARGNPKGIRSLEDLTKENVRVAMAPKASPPGGDAVMGILKKANLVKPVLDRVLDTDASCVQRTIMDVCTGKADCMIVERRITRMPRYADSLDLVEIPEELFPAGPLTFTVGLMKSAGDVPLAQSYINWITRAEGQAFFEKAGFIPAISEKGKELIAKLGVHDV